MEIAILAYEAAKGSFSDFVRCHLASDPGLTGVDSENVLRRCGDVDRSHVKPHETHTGKRWDARRIKGKSDKTVSLGLL